jgi:ubiquinone/menaquinone biosynthesis C-methylase UbiE
MQDDIKSYSQAANQLGLALKQECRHPSEVTLIKNQIQKSYNCWAQMLYDKAFLNWGLWDKDLYNEYINLDFNFSTVCNYQDIYSQLLIYYLIRPLTKIEFFDKRLLDIGCGNGIGLKVCSEILGTNYAAGVDLVHKLALNANTNFYKDNEINYIQSDAECLPFPEESFDIITNLESSHLYPQIERFFSEVERVLAPGGYFCYADIHITNKSQTKKLETFIKARKQLKIIQKVNITKIVQKSIYNRLIVNEDVLYNSAKALFGSDNVTLSQEFPALAGAMGLTFLPWWKIWFKNPELKQIAKNARKDRYWGKKYFFYYLVQKDGVVE